MLWGLLVFTKTMQVAAVGAAVVSAGWVTVVSPAVAIAQPLPIPNDGGITCPNTPGVQYLPDPDNPQATYVCADGSQRDYYVCPPGTVLDVTTTPPMCPSQEGYEGKP